ncbi:MAG: hypothetical protein Q9227_007908 [Pyrenula ochraceoflavens]
MSTMTPLTHVVALLLTLLLLFEPSLTLQRPQLRLDLSNQDIGYIFAREPLKNYPVGPVFHDPSKTQQPKVIGLIPPHPDDAYGSSYCIESGRLRGATPMFGSEMWFVMPETTGIVNFTSDADGDGASDGFTYGAENMLKYKGDTTSWWACAGHQAADEYVLYVQIGDVVPEDGTCIKVTLTGSNDAR